MQASIKHEFCVGFLSTKTDNQYPYNNQYHTAAEFSLEISLRGRLTGIAVLLKLSLKRQGAAGNGI